MTADNADAMPEGQSIGVGGRDLYLTKAIVEDMVEEHKGGTVCVSACVSESWRLKGVVYEDGSATSAIASAVSAEEVDDVRKAK